MSDFTLDSFQSARQLNWERGLYLARIVGRAVIPSIILVLLLVLFLAHPQFLQGSLLALGTMIAFTLVVIGVVLAERHEAEKAARFIVPAIQFVTTLFQVYWASTHGIDTIVLALFIAQTIPLGLASAMSGAALLRNTLIFDIGIITFLFLGSVRWFASELPVTTAIVGWVLTVFFSSTIAAMLYGGGVFYAQALQELGTIRAAYERVRQLDELKDQFITHVNHELRTPIMTMQGIIEFLQAAHTTMSAEQETQLFAQASRNAERLVTLLSSILDVRKIERDGTEADLGPITLSEAFQAAQQVVDPLGQRPFLFTLPSASAVWADAQVLQQILVNLLSNAVKYSPAGSPVEVGVTLHPEKGPPLIAQIAIRDHGPGIPPAQIPLLFHRFVRLPRDLASSVSGSGVGLYLSKVLTEAMGGRIWVENAGGEGDGAVFLVELPTVESALAVTAHREKMRERR